MSDVSSNSRDHDLCVCGHERQTHSGAREDDFECRVLVCSCTGFKVDEIWRQSRDMAGHRYPPPPIRRRTPEESEAYVQGMRAGIGLVRNAWPGEWEEASRAAAAVAMARQVVDATERALHR